MKVKTVEFACTAVKPNQYPKNGLPEFALAGRSNVGKSSFINKMVNRKNLARTSQKPGKTQTLNFYVINDALYFVDLPGYGFAKVSKKEREAWGQMIETYLYEREPLRGVILLIDLRHPPTEDDCLMYSWLKHHRIPVVLVATKADKVPKGKRQKHLNTIATTLKKEPDDELFPFSAETGEGKEEIWKKIASLSEVEAVDETSR
mgnify:CR=1 FL=1